MTNFANSYATRLSAYLLDGALTCTVDSVVGDPAVPYNAIIQRKNSFPDEIVTVTNVTGTTLTITRATEAVAGVQTAYDHPVGAVLRHIVTAGGLADLADNTAAWMAGARKAATPDLMPALPVVTQGAADGETVIADSVLTASMSDIWGTVVVDYTIFRYTGAPILRAGMNWPDNNFATSVSPSAVYKVSFTTDADEFEFWTKGTGGAYRMWVNGKLASAGPVAGPAATGSLYFIHVALGSAGTREITLEMLGGFGGIRVGPTYTVTVPTSDAPTIHAIVLGDSFTEGTGAGALFMSYVHTLARYLNWDIWASGRGGTGYLEPGAYVTFRTRVAADVIAYAPDVVIVAGGLNDPEAGLEAEADLLFAAIAAGLPAAKLVVLSPWCPRGGDLSALLAVKTAALAAAAATAGAQYIDTSTAPWMTGTGDAAGPNGTGNSDIYVGADHTHPTQAGHDYLAYRLSGLLW